MVLAWPQGTRGCFNDLDLTPLARCTALESLTLKRALGISGAFLADLARGCPRLATLRLFDCPLLEQRYLAAVRDMPALQVSQTPAAAALNCIPVSATHVAHCSTVAQRWLRGSPRAS